MKGIITAAVFNPFMPYLKEPRVTNWQHQISPYDINTEFWESVMRINEMIIQGKCFDLLLISLFL